MKKKCSICKRDKDIEEFNKNSSRSDGLASNCKLCANKLAKKHYKKNSAQMKKQIQNSKKNRIEEHRLKLFNYYNDHPCIDCTENDPMVLEMDHVRGKKIKEVSSMISEGYSWKKIQEEISKCEVRCANCHRRKTAIQQGWYMAKFVELKG